MEFNSRAHNFITALRASLGILLASGLFGLLIFIPSPAVASGDILVSISIDGTNRTVRTASGTVGDVLERAEIIVSENDLVEPTLSTVVEGPVFNINIFKSRPVLVHDGDQQYVVRSAYSSPYLIADDAGLDVHREDLVTLNRVEDFLTAGIVGEELNITRATPVVVELYGNKIDIRTHDITVAELLASKNVIPDDKDIVTPAETTVLKPGTVIKIIRVGVEVVTQTVDVDYDTRTINDSGMNYGQRLVETQGQVGSRIVTYEVTLHNDKEKSRTELKSIVSSDPIDEVVRVGTKITNSNSNVALGQELAAARGWTGDNWICLYQLWVKESQWNNLAQNTRSTAFGIPQFLDSTWAGVGYSKTTDPTVQIKAGMQYIAGRYGDPCGAWDFSAINGWY